MDDLRGCCYVAARRANFSPLTAETCIDETYLQINLPKKLLLPCSKTL